MENNFIITVGRQFCSGGAEIGHKVAKYLGVPYYDKEIIDEAAGLLKMTPEEIKKHDEKPPRIWDYPGYQYANYWYSDDPSLMLPVSIRIAEAQFSVIEKYADRITSRLFGEYRVIPFVGRDVRMGKMGRS